MATARKRKRRSPDRLKTLLHPVRFRVLQVLAPLRDEGVTAAEILAALGDVPAATLYRHLSALEAADFIAVASTRQVRGAIEKRYLAARSTLSREEAEQIDAEAYFELFMQHMAVLSSGLERQLQTGQVPSAAAGHGFRTTALWLSGDELRELREEVDETVRRRLKNRPRRGRKLQALSTILLPWAKEGRMG